MYTSIYNAYDNKYSTDNCDGRFSIIRVTVCDDVITYIYYTLLYRCWGAKISPRSTHPPTTAANLPAAHNHPGPESFASKMEYFSTFSYTCYLYQRFTNFYDNGALGK